MPVDTAPQVRKWLNRLKQTMYEIDLAFDRGDRDQLLRCAKQLVVDAPHFVTAIATYYFPRQRAPHVDRSYGLFPPTPPQRYP